jgi:hypothetical protein
MVARHANALGKISVASPGGATVDRRYDVDRRHRFRDVPARRRRFPALG